MTITQALYFAAQGCPYHPQYVPRMKPRKPPPRTLEEIKVGLPNEALPCALCQRVYDAAQLLIAAGILGEEWP